MPSMCTARLVRASSPPAAMKAVSARPTGTTAATSEPKTASRIPRVNGIDSISARLKSLPRVLLRACSPLASPTSSTRSDGFVFCTAATASSTGCTREDAVPASPVMSNVTSIECPSCDTKDWPSASSGECRLPTSFVELTAATTCVTADRKAASSGWPFLVCTSTFSEAASGNPDDARIRSAFAVCPLDPSALVICFVPDEPMTSAARTNTSHPMMAVLRWPALQAPMRAATFTVFPSRSCRASTVPDAGPCCRLGWRPSSGWG